MKLEIHHPVIESLVKAHLLRFASELLTKCVRHYINLLHCDSPGAERRKNLEEHG